ncbi:MAG: MBL fold metallo-hydrolase [Aigarchaeota archaeon]|nr:MBL fold metallo-hydrolase [Aigarchaeota archaeon]
MKVRFLAADSMGTRSMCTLIEAGDARIIIDPGAALGPRRYGLKPHQLEYERLSEHKELIESEAAEADLIIITHYHYDHFPRPGEEVGWLMGKRILLKDPVNHINFSQRWRAKIFLEELKKIDAKVEIADSREIKIGRCRVAFSKPVQHGNDSRLGFVLETLISSGGEKVVHSSDVEGFVGEVQIKFVLEHEPDMLICDGPMTYMLGSRFTEIELERSINNLLEIIKRGFLHELVIDHHLMRDLEWKSRIRGLLDAAESRGIHVTNAARYTGLPEDLLEARRRELYEKFRNPGTKS